MGDEEKSRHQKYYQLHKEELKAKRRKQYAANREKELAYAKRIRESTPLLIKERQRVYRDKCKEKVQARWKAYHAKNREKLLVHKRMRRAADPEKTRAANIRYHSRRNKEQVRATNRVYYAKGGAGLRGKRRVYHRQWSKEHRVNINGYRTARRAQKRGSSASGFTGAQWNAMQEVYDHRCVYCGTRRKGRLTQDHITPLSKGGAHTYTNIVPACRTCNSKKNTGSPLVQVQPLLLVL